MSIYVPGASPVIPSGAKESLSHDIADYPDGVVLPIDKPYRWTSADVIRKVKFAAFRHFRKKNLKVGHAGTLDPLATGVLLVCLGPACKRAQEFQDHDKEYVASVRFGATTPSYDLEKEVDRTFPFGHITRADVEAALPAFLGEQEQVAPLFSAKSVDGVRAYEMARRAYRQAARSGGDFDHSAAELLSRQKINISALELVSFGKPVREMDCYKPNPRINVTDISQEEGLVNAEILVDCSKGTYIRALARDWGEALGSGAFLNNLRRTRCGDFKVEEALGIEEALECFG